MRIAKRKKGSLSPIGNTFWALLLLLYEISGCLGASDDITNMWYFRCRWFGGSVNMVSCNCTPEAEEMYVQRNSIPGYDTSIIEINDCSKVRFGPNAIYDLNNLRSVLLNNIDSLTFEPNSLNWVGYRDTNVNQEERFDLSIPSLKVIIRNSKISTISSQTFGGRINEITFESVDVEHIEAFAFANLLQMENLVFKNVRLKDVKPQAFKKFGTEFLTLDGVNADYLPSRTFSNVTVYRRLLIDNSNFHTLRPATFLIHNPQTFTVANTRINQLEGEAFLVTTTGDVVFRNNYFNTVHDEAFRGIGLNTNQVTSARTITFDSNTFSNLDRRSLEVQPTFEARVMNLSLNESCNCDNIIRNLKNSEFYSDISCLDGDLQYVTVRDFKAANCSVLAGYYTLIIIVCVLVLVAAFVGTLFYVYYRLVYRKQKYGCEKGGKPPLSLIVPDGRTYKETELHVIVEKADLLTTDL